MDALDEEYYAEHDFDEAEGVAEMDEDSGMFDLAEEYDDELEDGFDADSYEEGSSFYDELESAGAMDDDFEDAFEFEDGYDEEALEDVMAYALGAEDADEFFGRLFKGLKKVARVVRKAAPMVGKIAGGVSRVASMIPHPYAQAIGSAANLVSRGAKLVQRLRAEGASEEEAVEAFAELAARDPRALPILAGVTARTILKSKGSRMPAAARKQAVQQMKGAAKTLVQRRGTAAARALPKIARSVKRTAAAKGASPTAAVKVVRKAASTVAKNPALTRKLARPSPLAKRRVAQALRGTGVKPRSYTIPGPARITISAA